MGGMEKREEERKEKAGVRRQDSGFRSQKREEDRREKAGDRRQETGETKVKIQS